MAKNDPVFLDTETDKKYDLFVKDNFEEFKNTYSDVLIKDSLEFQPRLQTFECVVVKKAKLLISEYMNSIGYKIFNEIEARVPGEFGAPKIDLCDLDKNIGIEIHWKHKQINHSEMIERMKTYEKIYGKCYLILVSWGEGNGFKEAFGFVNLKPHNLEKYNQANIPVVFFNVDKPNFYWFYKVV